MAQTKFQAIQKRLKTNPLNVSQPKPVVTQPITQPAPNPAVSVFPTGTQTVQRPRVQQNFGLGSAEGGPVNPTLATRDNPVIAVSTVPTPVDVNTADQNTLLKEQDAINYKISTGNFTQDDFVRGREISRKLAESLYKSPEQVDNPYLTQLEEQANKVKARDNNPLVEAKRTQLQANLDTRKAQLEENARKARESTIGNIAMAGGGRSSVAQQAELDIQKELQNQLNAEQAAMNLEIMAYQRELAGADSKELEGINQSINALRTQAAQGQQALQTQSQAKIQEATSQFDTNLQNLARSRGIELDINDEKAIEQFITIARNPDGTVNETFLKTLAPQYQELVRAGVSSGIGRMNFTPKVERLGGTTKNPVYGYRDPNKGSFVTTNAMGVPTGGVRTGGGGGSGFGVNISTQGDAYNLQSELLSAIGQIRDAANNSLVRGTNLYDPDIENLKAFVKSNMTLDTFQNLKKQGVKMGSMTDSEWKLLGDTVGDVSGSMSKGAINKALDNVQGRLTGIKVSAPTNTTTTPTKGTTGVSKYKGRKII